MLQITHHMNIYAATEPMNFKNRFDGTAAICRNTYQKDPYSGALFVFTNRVRTMIRCYSFNGLGEWLCDLRISQGRFPHWIIAKDKQRLTELQVHELYVLLQGGNPAGIKTPPRMAKNNLIVF